MSASTSKALGVDQLRRQRAPTITIDTSAVSSSSPPQDMNADALPMRSLSDPLNLQDDHTGPASTECGSAANTQHRSTQQQSDTGTRGSQPSRSSGPEPRAAPYSEGRDGEHRPQSPHNVSSPISRGQERQHGFLSVPTNARSRQNSIDSDDGWHSSSSTAGQSTLGVGSSHGDLETDQGSSSSTRNAAITNAVDALTPDPGDEEDFERENNKFAYTPGQLNKMLDPKSLAAFWALGGLKGIEKGLQSNRRTGLSVDETVVPEVVTFEEAARKDGVGSSESAKTSTIQVSSREPAATPTETAGTSAQGRTDGQFSDRRGVFGDNRLPVKKGKSFLQLVWITYNDKVLILLSVAAVVSLAIGLYQTFGTPHDPSHPPVDWVEGVAIIIAIVVVVVVGSLNDYQKERQFAKLNKKKQDRLINVIRSGTTQSISVFDLLVGDVVHLEPGDSVPADGIFIDGYDVKCDESQATGESDLIKKTPADEVLSVIRVGGDARKLDPFILSGAQVTQGIGTFLCTSTGVHSTHGKIMMSLREDPDVTPLQSKLNTLAEYIAKLGGAAGLLLFVVLFIEFLVRLPHDPSSPAQKGQNFLNIFIVTVTIIVVAVPEGLPLAVTLALAFATTRMLKDNNLVRHLKACEVMGNATAICSDKTGTLTQNEMTVVAGTVGTSSRFGGVTEAQDSIESPPRKEDTKVAKIIDNIPPQEVVHALHESTRKLLVQSIAINSTAFEGTTDRESGFIGSKTETALLKFSRDFLGMGPVSQERANANVVQFIPFDSKQKCMGVIVKLETGKFRLLVKGASEILLAQCSFVVRDPTKDVAAIQMTEEDRQTFNTLITSYAERSLRTIAMTYRDFTVWPPKHVRRVTNESDEVIFGDIFKQMTMIGVVGIQDPIRAGVREAVETCQKAGVVVRMVTGDNVTTAKAIAAECGIWTSGGLVMEGPAFRKLNRREMCQMLPKLQVLARSSPEDKRVLVTRLKELGETVAVTGDGTNDAPALKTADVGFSMGIAGTEVAKEASAIILMDDNFASIVKAMMWGRAVNDAVKKFLQFQVTVNITAVVLTFISAVSSGSESSVLTAVQLLWVNLIMDTMAALALATDPPLPSILDRKPDPKSAPLISATMWKMITGQALYQLVVTLVLYFGSYTILSYDTPDEQSAIPTLVFNTFVWMQIFNAWNNRRLDNGFNIFEGITQNYFFIGINLVMVGGQVIIIFLGGAAFSVQPLNGTQWALSLVLGFLSIPVGAAIRLIPDGVVAALIPGYLSNRSAQQPQSSAGDEEQQFYFPQALTDVKDELSFLKRVKGGRLNNLVFAIQHPVEAFMPRSRSGSCSRNNSVPQTPTDVSRENSTASARPSPEGRRRGRSSRSRSNSALGATTVMAGIIAGSVAGWSPIERGHGDGEFASFPRPYPRTGSGPAEAESGRSDLRSEGPMITEEPPSYSSKGAQESSDEVARSTLDPPQSFPASKDSETSNRNTG